MQRHTTTNCPPWTLRAWPPLLWQADRKSQLRLRHLVTRVTNPGDQVTRTAGQTVWATEAASGEAGMAWDWVQLSRGIVAMADPMAVVTNLRLLNPEGEELTALESALHLNAIVHALPWQGEVARALSMSTLASAA